MKVEIKNLKFHQGHDGHGFNADIFINGVKCMHVYDGAYGGEFEYTDYSRLPNAKNPERIKELNAELEAYVKTLPAVEFQGTKLDMNMDMYIEELIQAKEKEKEEKKKLKLMQKAILVGVPNANQYSYYAYKVALASIPTNVLQKHVDSYKAKLKQGEVILNTNLAQLNITI